MKTKEKCGPKYFPKTENQKKYVELLNFTYGASSPFPGLTSTYNHTHPSSKPDIIFALGPAGTGKTLFAGLKAIHDLKNGVIDKIIITRPAVCVDEDLGFLPGDINHKMDPWMRPIFDIFLEYYKQKEIDHMVHSGMIEISPLAFMRGRTFKRCFILADEMQNSSPNQLLMLLTRIGTDSQMVVTGDLKQSDRPEENGLAIFVKKMKRFVLSGGRASGIEICHLDDSDIERNPVIQQVLQIFHCDSSAPLLLPEAAQIIQNSTSCQCLPSSKKNVSTTNGCDDAALIPSKDFFTKNKLL